MKTHSIILGLIAVLSVLAGCSDGGRKSISEVVLRDKIYGAWAGKVIGVQYGQPHEFWYLGRINEGELPWTDEMVEGAIDQDDIYTQISFLQTFDKYGLDASADQLARDFADAGFMLFHANLQARKNWFDGLRPPLTGSAAYNAHADDIDFQIDADFIGLMCPGMPLMVREYCDRIGTIMCDGDGINGGIFIATMHSLAFFESDIPAIVEEALKSIPSQSAYARCISDVLECYRKDPEDWRAAWNMLHERWEGHICIPYHPFNIDAKMNGAYVVTGLLYGGDDFDKTMEIAVRCGQDADCNASNAAAIWGAVHGWEGLPDRYKNALHRIDGQPFSYTRYSWTEAADKIIALAGENILRAGGRFREGIYRIRSRRPSPGDGCRVSFPDERYRLSHCADGPAWTFSGAWEKVNGWDEDVFLRTEEAGACAELTFEGSMIVLTGSWGPQNGMADVYLDGQKIRRCDSWWTYDCGAFALNRQVLFVASDLSEGEHKLRVEVCEEHNPSSSGRRFDLLRADIYSTL